MSGKCTGATARTTRVFHKAPYVHCASHVLNLAVVSAYDTQLVKNMMSTVHVVSDMFNVIPTGLPFGGKHQAILPTASHTILSTFAKPDG
eukprot:gene15526-17109_t